jgi:hypothetical protein
MSMSKRFFSAVGVASVLFALVAGVAAAQSAKKVQFQTSFAFLVNGTEMPAGRYELEVQQMTAAVLALRNLQTKERVVVKPITRLADLGGTEPQVVFDKTESSHYLAEVHFPGMDGFDLQHAPGEHTHERVPAKQ